MPKLSWARKNEILQEHVQRHKFIIRLLRGGAVSSLLLLIPIGFYEFARWARFGPVVPIMGTGATDSLYFRQVGIPMYGVSGLLGDIDDNRAHGRDERLGVRVFYEGQEFLDRLVKSYAGSGATAVVK